MILFMLIAGLVLLLVGGEAVVRGAMALAARTRLPPAVVGSTVLAIGTSLPELFVSVQAARRGVPGIAVGNVVGSNVYNLLLILGVAALILPIKSTETTRRVDSGWMLVSAVGGLAALAGGLSTLDGVVLLGALVAYLVVQARQAGLAPQEESSGELGGEWWLLPGLAGILIGANMFVGGAEALALEWGVPPRIVGLTVVSIGTSLPELTASVSAALRGESQLALGNVLGSNVFNVLGILGVTALLAPGPVTLATTDLAVFGGSAVLVFLSLHLLGGVPRAVGGILLAGAVVYTAVLVLM